jgi:hypothetical protein
MLVQKEAPQEALGPTVAAARARNMRGIVVVAVTLSTHFKWASIAPPRSGRWQAALALLPRN